MPAHSSLSSTPFQSPRQLVEAAKKRGLIRGPEPEQRVQTPQNEFQRLIEDAKRRGLIRGPEEPEPSFIRKDGFEAALEAGLRTVWMDVDPATARTWLENNLRNRKLSEDVVAAYARDMSAGLWAATHQGLAFNDQDELIDGQHRLHAIIRSGLTMRMMVTFGMPSRIAGTEMTTMDAVDRGRTRSVADQLRIQHGMKDGTIIAAMCASLAAICSSERTRRLSVGQTLQIRAEFECAISHLVLARPAERGLRSAGVLAAFAFAMTADESATGQFAQLASGNARRGSPIDQLREFLVSDQAKLLSRRTDRGIAELVLQALDLDRRGSSEQLELSQAGADYFRSRQPERVARIANIFAPGKVLP